MAGRSFILWLHGLDDSGPANQHIKNHFTSPEFKNALWSFPSAPSISVTCNYGRVTPSWFDIHEIPISSDSQKNESSVLKAVQNVHVMIDKEVAAGTNPNNVFICGESQGGALTLASILLYPKTLGGGAIFSGWVPLNSSFIQQITPEAKKLMADMHWAGGEGRGSIPNFNALFNVLHLETPILWLHSTADKTVLFEAGQAGSSFLEQAGMSCEFKSFPDLGYSINNEELQYLESWIKPRMSLLE